MSTANPRLISHTLFRMAWLFIIAVSVYDAYLVLRLRDVIHATERNPLGLTLLALAGGHVWLFLLVKVCGTIVACMFLLLIYRSNGKLGLTIVAAVATFQLALLLFLQFA